MILPKTVLIVDDEPLLRLLLTHLFENAGFCVLDADSADLAAECLREQPALDLLVTDVRMAGEDGPDEAHRNERDTGEEGPPDGPRTFFGDQGGRRLRLTEDHIQSVLLVRRARASVLGKNLFSDPAWDMLLELYAASLAGRSVTLSELARVTETPTSVAARWAQALEESGNISVDRDASPFQVSVKLTAEGVSRMQSFNKLARWRASALLCPGFENVPPWRAVTYGSSVDWCLYGRPQEQQDERASTRTFRA